MVADGKNLYWVDGSNIMQAAAIAAPTPFAIATGQAAPAAIAVDASYVYWTNNLGGAVMRVTIGGGSMPEVVSTSSQPGPLVLDDTYAYWIDNGGFERAPKAGGMPTLLASGGGGGIAVDGTYIYTTNGDIWRMPKDGSGPFGKWFAPLPDWMIRSMAPPLEADSTTIISGGLEAQLGAGVSLFAVIRNDGTPFVYNEIYGNVQQVATFAPFVYLASCGGSCVDNFIGRVHECGGGFEAMRKSTDVQTASMAVDDRYIYWTDLSSSVIRRTPK